MLTYIMLAGGLLGLFLGGDWLVRGASQIAARFNVPPLIIGLTIVGFGTSTPELLVSLQAAFDGLPGISIGNVVGSNTANILLILGVAGIIAPPIADFMNMRRDLFWMLGAALVMPVIIASGYVGRIEGAALITGLIIYLGLSFRAMRNDPTEALPSDVNLLHAAGFTIAGLIAVMVGAKYLVESATIIARHLGVSEAMIGLSIVAIGTSLPELATTVAAAIKGEREIALGNIIGSNIFNILAILGLTGLIIPIPVDTRFMSFDVPVMICATLLILGLIYVRGEISRIAGGLMILAYIGYIAIGASL
ncbi:MAG: calcium/sodium antiporter [Loktanella sp.]|nr:calcium/sodium antiporter [Loktanella sp.]MDO7623608.1 calcium/sodium antiporter [Loktanella sp.]MDO7627090.1 calcium/sodium antiporter [Loktanella sp.]MDO7630097.1 calcium/sodium antiporter [Loktanella sp.]MDO7665707.1 calcium/sodium antiporter [Loktanella sp.]